MKKFIALVLCLGLMMSMASVAMAAYGDTADHWAEDEINQWTAEGIFDGREGDQFVPEGGLRRGEAAKIIATLLKLTEKGDISGYPDMDPTAWYADPIALCVAAGIMNGVENGNMAPTAPVSRQMFFVMFARGLGIAPEATMDKTMGDSDDIAPWAAGYVNALVNNEFVKGMAGDLLAPGKAINRASAAALLSQTIVAYADEAGTVTATGDGIVLVVADDVKVVATGNVTVIVASDDANVDLSGVTGTANVIVAADDAVIANAPVGTNVTVTEDVTTAKVNGTTVAPNTETTVAPAAPVTPVIPDPAPEVKPGDEDEKEEVEESQPVQKPSITIGDKEYQWDPDEKEYVTGDGDEKEYIDQAEMDKIIADQKEQGNITIDGKEYTWDAEEGEWLDDKEEAADIDSIISGGSNDSAPVA